MSGMKAHFAFMIASCVGSLLAAAAVKDAPVVMPEIIVIGKKIPDGWFTVSWRCNGPLPLDRVKRAWISNVLPDSPAAKAGVQIDDTLLAIGDVPVERMTGGMLRWNLQREREAGTKEEFWIKTNGGEKRLFVVRFEKGASRSR
jgi:S1-C subfamily serine protease